MKTILVRILGCAALAAGSISCVEVPGGYPPYRGGYGGGYGGGYDHGHNHETHCYCSHHSCGCHPGHPKSGCYCDHGEHRH